MKAQKITLMIATVLMALHASAAGVVEIRPMESKDINELFRTEMKAGRQELGKTGVSDKVVQTLTADLVKLTGGKLNPREFGQAIKVKFNVQGESKPMDMIQVVKSISDAAKTREKAKGTDAKSEELLKQKDLAIALAPEFISLAAVMSPAGKADAHVNAYAKQVSLIPEMLATMDVEAVRSHVEIMQLAIDAKKQNPELNGDEALVKALQAKFPDKVEQKIADLNGCARAGL